ncbi:TetR/AcrR family transcriptional regulator [Actinomyces polynesiensis]|uniref:TetR/AcrR family transcriptional regulator n=1 Tax=Actinomyces polynesiensis TaxID=1325934 RepID=UPI0006947E35|nr:TetR/AcrR family transcriptional regulator [Actinomyces polynesiensis]
MTRSDAARNRQTLVDAAEAVFTEHGPDAPLALVTARSGLGRGTLYRHFPNRIALVSAIYGARLDRYLAHTRAHAEDPEVLLDVIAMIAWDQYSIPGMFRIIHANAQASDQAARLWERTEAVFSEPLEISRDAGVVREDLTVNDVLLVLAMLYGVAQSPSTEKFGRAAVERTLVHLRRMLT